MSDNSSHNPFRRRPYLDFGIDTLKVLLIAVLCLILFTAIYFQVV
jgi:hypothetical protein